jgi:hypothetical protein
MSGSRTQLASILELLLNEDTEKASELLHEYVVGKAREEYERVLDEDESEFGYDDEAEDYEDEIDGDEIGEDEEEDDVIDQSDDFVDDVTDDGEDDGEDDFGGDDEFDDEEGEGDVEDRVEDLEAELDDLRAEFERLMGGDEEGMDDDMGGDMDMDMGGDEFGGDDMDMGGDEEMMDSVEYDLDEAEEVDEEEVDESDDDDEDSLEEATQFSKNTSEQPMKGGNLKGSEADNTKSPYTQAPKPTKVGADGAKTFHNNDGGEGKRDHGGKPSNQDPTNKNFAKGGESKGKAKSHGTSYGSGAKKPEMGDKNSPFTRKPK